MEELLEVTDFVQLMTVNPGFGGQEFLESQLGKIERLREMLQQRGLNSPIAVDGGIDNESAPKAVNAGATVLVAGSSVFNTKASVAENVAALRASIEKGDD